MKPPFSRRKRAQPLISCLMISSPANSRWTWFEKSLQSFARQTYQNKELVVVFNRLTPTQKTQALRKLSNVDSNQIRAKFVSGKPSLGTLRNVSMQIARGEIFSLWDDDDVSHPLRLELQYGALRGNQAVYLQNAFQFFPDFQTVFWVNWSKYKNDPIRPAGLPGTLMFRKSLGINFSPRLDLNEDVEFFRRLWKKGHKRCAFLNSRAPLFTYVYHGANAWPEQHHLRSAVINSVSLSKCREAKKHLTLSAQEMGLGETPVRLMTSAGLAFDIQ